MAAALETKNKRWTYDEYFKLDEDQRYEILNGELLMAPSPDTWHQNWVGSLFRILDSHTRGRNLGKVIGAEWMIAPGVSAPRQLFVFLKNTLQLGRRLATAARSETSSWSSYCEVRGMPPLSRLAAF
jgi:Uma2 family endonuclease